MPIYDYVCRDCSERIEVMHAVHAPGPDKCQVCGGPMRKALSTPAIVFKGSGWAKKDARAAAASRSKAGDKTQAGSAKSAESSPTEGSSNSAAKEATSPSST